MCFRVPRRAQAGGDEVWAALAMGFRVLALCLHSRLALLGIGFPYQRFFIPAESARWVKAFSVVAWKVI